MRFLLLAVLITCGSGSTFGQTANSAGTDEQVIRKLDMSEVDAVLRRDFAALEKLWGQDFTVNAPNNQVVKGRAEVLKLFHAGFATYSSFVREIESLQTYENTVIVMGLEDRQAYRPGSHGRANGAPPLHKHLDEETW